MGDNLPTWGLIDRRDPNAGLETRSCSATDDGFAREEKHVDSKAGRSGNTNFNLTALLAVGLLLFVV